MVPIIAAVFIAPLLGFVGGFAVMVAFCWIFRACTPSIVEGRFRRLQAVSASFLAYAHGLNDGQMTVGVMLMSLVLFTGNVETWNAVPWWVIFLAAFSMSVGTAAGGWQVIKTLGMSITTLRPVHGFAAEFSSGLVVEIASLLGIPVSTTHNISASIFGVGSVTRIQAVRWRLANNIFAAWIFTFPLCGALGYVIALGLRFIFG